MKLTLEHNSYAMAELNLTLNRLAESTGKTLKEVLPSQMRLLAADLAFVTYPKGKGSNDNLIHQARIQSRINEVYPHIGTVVNELKNVESKIVPRFVKYLSNRQYGQAKLILDKYLPRMNISVGAFDGGKLHRDQSEQKNVTRRLLVPMRNRVDAYANKTKKKSGFAKGGFATAAKQLGGVRGIPGFATRQKAPGTGIVSGDGRTLTVTMTNLVNYLSEGALRRHDEVAAVNNRQKNVTILLDRIQTNKIKRIMKR